MPVVRLDAVVRADTGDADAKLVRFERTVARTASTAQASQGRLRGFFGEIGAGGGALSGATSAALGFVGAQGAIGAARGAVESIRGIITGGAELNETLNKVEVTFGTSAGTVTKEADRMAKRFGYARQTFLDAASSIGLIAKGAGVAVPAAARMGRSMATLAADASSFYNVPVADALTAIRSGLVGESEPLRRYGVLVSESAVGTEALRLGLAKTGAKLTDQQKVLARASLITRGFRDASGDLARTQDSVANRLREVQGRLTNYAADLGVRVLPVVSTLIETGFDLAGSFGRTATAVGRDLRPAFDDLVGAGANVASALGDLWHAGEPVVRILGGLSAAGAVAALRGAASAALVLSGALGSVASFLADHQGLVIALAGVYAARLVPAIAGTTAVLGRLLVAGTVQWFRDTAGSVVSFASALGRLQFSKLTVGLTGLGVGLGILYEGFTRNARVAQDFADQVAGAPRTLDQLRQAINRTAAEGERLQSIAQSEKFFDVPGIDKAVYSLNSAGAAARKAADDSGELADANRELLRLYHGAERVIDRVSGATGLSTKAVERLAERTTDGLIPALQKLRDEHGGRLGPAVAELTRNLRDEATSLDDATPATEQLADATEVLGDETATATDQAKGLRDALDALVGVHVDALEAEIRYRDAVRDLSASLAEGGRTLDINSEAGSKNLTAVTRVIEAILGQTDALRNQGATMDQLRATYGAHVEDLRRVLAASGLTRAQIDGLVASLHLVDGTSAFADVGVAGVPQAHAAIAGLEQHLAQMGANVNKALVQLTLGPATANRPAPQPATRKTIPGLVTGEARGGVLRPAGPENHIAQIARAGTWRVWAEDETGGEAYIPLAPAKRRRSTQVLHTVANEFGYGLIPQADGGVLRERGVVLGRGVFQSADLGWPWRQHLSWRSDDGNWVRARPAGGFEVNIGLPGRPMWVASTEDGSVLRPTRSTLRFRRDVRLDPSQVTDRRGQPFRSARFFDHGGIFTATEAANAGVGVYLEGDGTWRPAFRPAEAALGIDPLALIAAGVRLGIDHRWSDPAGAIASLRRGTPAPRPDRLIAAPVAWSGDRRTLVDTGTGRRAYYGPGGEPGGPLGEVAPPPAGARAWRMPDGARTWYRPGRFDYAEPGRASNQPDYRGVLSDRSIDSWPSAYGPVRDRLGGGFEVNRNGWWVPSTDRAGQPVEPGIGGRLPVPPWTVTPGYEASPEAVAEAIANFRRTGRVRLADGSHVAAHVAAPVFAAYGPRARPMALGGIVRGIGRGIGRGARATARQVVQAGHRVVAASAWLSPVDEWVGTDPFRRAGRSARAQVFKRWPQLRPFAGDLFASDLDNPVVRQGLTTIAGLPPETIAQLAKASGDVYVAADTLGAMGYYGKAVGVTKNRTLLSRDRTVLVSGTEGGLGGSTLPHELGHTLDDALGRPSDQRAFAPVAATIAALGRKGGLGAYYDDPAEAFAEAFSLWSKPGKDPGGIDQYFAKLLFGGWANDLGEPVRRRPRGGFEVWTGGRWMPSTEDGWPKKPESDGPTWPLSDGGVLDFAWGGIRRQRRRFAPRPTRHRPAPRPAATASIARAVAASAGDVGRDVLRVAPPPARRRARAEQVQIDRAAALARGLRDEDRSILGQVADTAGGLARSVVLGPVDLGRAVAAELRNVGEDVVRAATPLPTAARNRPRAGETVWDAYIRTHPLTAGAAGAAGAAIGTTRRITEFAGALAGSVGVGVPVSGGRTARASLVPGAPHLADTEYAAAARRGEIVSTVVGDVLSVATAAAGAPRALGRAEELVAGVRAARAEPPGFSLGPVGRDARRAQAGLAQRALRVVRERTAGLHGEAGAVEVGMLSGANLAPRRTPVDWRRLEHSPRQTFDRLAEAATAWATGEAGHIRERADLLVADPRVVDYGRGPRGSIAMARRLMAASERGNPVADLYRGMAVDDATLERFVATGEFDIPLAGFTTEPQVAGGFALGRPPRPLILHLPERTPALAMSDLLGARHEYGGEAEHLVSGRFEQIAPPRTVRGGPFVSPADALGQRREHTVLTLRRSGLVRARAERAMAALERLRERTAGLHGEAGSASVGALSGADAVAALRARLARRGGGLPVLGTGAGLGADVLEALRAPSAVEDALAARHPGVRLSVTERPDEWVLNAITVAERGRGTGTRVMAELVAMADEANKRVTLTPSTSLGGSSVARLESFYRRFGFVPNRGRTRDLTTTEAMIRRPSPRSGATEAIDLRTGHRPRRAPARALHRGGLVHYAQGGAYRFPVTLGVGINSSVAASPSRAVAPGAGAVASSGALVSAPPGTGRSVGRGWQSIAAYLRGAGVPFTVTSTTGGRHSPSSLHRLGRALDAVGPDRMAIARSLDDQAPALAELLYTPLGHSVKDGRRVTPPIAAAGHYGHVHAATFADGGMVPPGVGAGGGGLTAADLAALADRLAASQRSSPSQSSTNTWSFAGAQFNVADLTSLIAQAQARSRAAAVGNPVNH